MVNVTVGDRVNYVKAGKDGEPEIIEGVVRTVLSADGSSVTLAKAEDESDTLHSVCEYSTTKEIGTFHLKGEKMPPPPVKVTQKGIDEVVAAQQEDAAAPTEGSPN